MLLVSHELRASGVQNTSETAALLLRDDDRGREADAASVIKSGTQTRNSKLKLARSSPLDLQNHRHDQRPFLRLLVDVALQVGPNLLFDHAVIRLFFLARDTQRLDHDLLRPLDQPVFAGIKAAGYDFRRRLHHACQFVDRGDGPYGPLLAG